MRIWSEVEFYMHFPHLKKIKFLWTSNPITRTCKLASALWLFISNYPGRTKALKFPTDYSRINRNEARLLADFEDCMLLVLLVLLAQKASFSIF